MSKWNKVLLSGSEIEVSGIQNSNINTVMEFPNGINEFMGTLPDTRLVILDTNFDDIKVANEEFQSSFLKHFGQSNNYRRYYTEDGIATGSIKFPQHSGSMVLDIIVTEGFPFSSSMIDKSTIGIFDNGTTNSGSGYVHYVNFILKAASNGTKTVCHFFSGSDYWPDGANPLTITTAGGTNIMTVKLMRTTVREWTGITFVSRDRLLWLPYGQQLTGV